ncbi:MAG TPA: carbohydrate binding domain-containing protein [Anaerolineae bacterium]|nr:carbohydrate binding domain-containing protein [Anaerolineae bacterium]HQI85016.1 carbohydrate binding domain-containing protein [Anaerolineae bacterium]
MILNGRVIGLPLVQYTDTQANIEALALTASDAGALAWATDTAQIGVYDGSAWVWGLPGSVVIGDAAAGDLLQLQSDGTWANVTPDVAVWPYTGAINQEPGGFVDPANVGVAYDYTARTITLTHSSGTLVYYVAGVRYTLSSPWTSDPHDATNGAWYLYDAGAGPVWAQTIGMFAYAQLAYANYNTPAGAYFGVRECHGLMAWETHRELHEQIGTYRRSGGAPTAGTYQVQPAPPANADNTPGFDAAVVADEDLPTTVGAWTQGTYTLLYFSGSGTVVFNTAASLPFRVGTTYPVINGYAGGTFTDAETATNKYFNVYQVLLPATSDAESQKYRMLMLQPQAVYTSLAAAQAEDYRSLYLGGLTALAPEFVAYTRITFGTSAAYGTTGKCRIEALAYLVGPRAIQAISGGVVYGQATETTLGVIELATAAEVKAGTDTERAVTPAGLAGLIALNTPATDGKIIKSGAGALTLNAASPYTLTVAAAATVSGTNTGDVTLAASADEVLDVSGQTLSLDPKASGLVLAGPLSGAAAAPTFKHATHVLVAAEIAKRLFSAADGLLLLGPGCAITPTSWTSTRGQMATISGAFHQTAGPWIGTRGLVVEISTTNLCTNPSFETGTSGWTASGTTLSQSSYFSVVGSNSGKLVATAADSFAYGDFVSNPPAGTTYTLTGWVRGDSTTIGKTMRFTLREQGGASGAQDSYTDVVLTGSWQKFKVTRTIDKADRTALQAILARNSGSTVGDTRYVDSIQLEATAYATSYCDGSLGSGYTWTGTPHASTSVRTTTEVNLDTTAGVVSGLNALSISAWVQAPYASTPGGWATGYPTILNVYKDASNEIRLLYNATTTGYFYLAVNGSSLTAGASALTFSAGDWLHIVATLDFTSDVYRVYVNGIRAVNHTATALTAPTGLNQMNIGSSYVSASQWGGAIAEVTLFNRVLTAEEVAAIYVSDKPLADTGALVAPVVSGLGLRLPLSYNNVSNPPTDTELTIAFGWQPDGFTAIVDDAGAATNCWKVWRASGAWWYEELTKAT